MNNPPGFRREFKKSPLHQWLSFALPDVGRAKRGACGAAQRRRKSKPSMAFCLDVRVGGELIIMVFLERIIHILFLGKT